MSRGAARALAICTGLAIALVLFLWPCDFGFMARPAARMASRALHRQVQIGSLSAHLLSWTPTVTIEQLRVANADWAQGPDLLQIGSVTVGIEPWQLLRGRLSLSQLRIDDPQINLQRDAQRRENWQFDSAAQTPQPQLEPLRIDGHGTLNGKPFELTFQGSALFNLRLDQPYHFHATVTAGPLKAAADGQIDKPFDLAHFGAM